MGAREATAQEWSVRMTESVMKRHMPLADRWGYEYGLVLQATERVWHATEADRYYHYVTENVDRFVGPTGEIDTYMLQEYNLDQINSGKVLFWLHERTGDDRYPQAANRLMEQLEKHPRTSEGGFWHKYLEASASCMNVYALAKGIRK